jgi:hypothetical protein
LDLLCIVVPTNAGAASDSIDDKTRAIILSLTEIDEHYTYTQPQNISNDDEDDDEDTDDKDNDDDEEEEEEEEDDDDDDDDDEEEDCKSTFSVEIPLTVTEIDYRAFQYCHCLRNVALPSDAVIGDIILGEATDLLLLFGSELEMIRNLKNRFNELPIHSSVYYRSYQKGVLQRLITLLMHCFKSECDISSCAACQTV